MSEGFGETYNVPLPESDLIILGKITSLFPIIDLALLPILMHLSGVLNLWKFNILCGPAGTRDRAEMLRKFALLDIDPATSIIWTNDVRKAAIKVASDVVSVCEKRNHIAHGAWGSVRSDKPTHGHVINPEKVKKRQKMTLSTSKPGKGKSQESLTDLYQEIEGALHALFALKQLMGIHPTTVKLPIFLTFTPGITPPKRAL